MKSRTSCFNSTVFKKDITRFAPAWVLYILGLILCLMLLLDTASHWLPSHCAETIQIMPVASFCVALVAVQLLFGDLFTGRNCNMLHALPLRRETWFFTHVVSGLLFSLIPTAIMAVLMGIVLAFTGTGTVIVALWWFVASNLQYLFFFGSALFCLFCTGNRLAAVMVYGIFHFLSMMAMWLVQVVYLPLFYGLVLNTTVFEWFSPVVAFTQSAPVYVEQEIIRDTLGDAIQRNFFVLHDGDAWLYLAICTLVGIGLGAAALAMYRKRDLEAAGDFIAIRVLSPIFLVVYTAAAGVVLQSVVTIFLGGNLSLALPLGLVIGFFTGLMFLNRSTRVFTRRNFAKFGILAAVLLASIGLCIWDPAGIETWVPEVSQVEKVSINQGYYMGNIILTEPEDIEAITQAHAHAIAHPDEWREVAISQEVATKEVLADVAVTEAYFHYSPSVRMRLTYTMKNGQVKERDYTISGLGKAGQLLRPYYSDIRCVLQEVFNWRTDIDYSDARELASHIRLVEFNQTYITDADQIVALMEAIIADCNDLNLPQEDGFIGSVQQEFYGHFYLETEEHTGNFQVYPIAENVLAWAEANGLMPEEDVLYD